MKTFKDYPTCTENVHPFPFLCNVMRWHLLLLSLSNQKHPTETNSPTCMCNNTCTQKHKQDISKLLLCPQGIIIRIAAKTKWPPHSMYYTLHVNFFARKYSPGFIRIPLSFANADNGSRALSMHKRCQEGKKQASSKITICCHKEMVR